MHESNSNFVGKESCPECGSRDNLGRYDDGHAHCFSQGCDYWEPPTDGSAQTAQSPKKAPTFNPVQGETRALPKRAISLETCKHFGYQVGLYQGQPAHICNIYNSKREIIGQKIRLPDKDFRFLKGPETSKPLIGSHLFAGGRKLIITEGEIDMMSISQIEGNKYPVVSIPNGADSAKRALAENISYLKGFKEVILCFDQDEPGQIAAKECADLLLGAVDVKIAKLQLKDANEMLLAGRISELKDAIWRAQAVKPEGVLKISDILEDCLADPVEGDPWWLDELTKATFGRRYGEIYTLGAGTGCGKTDFFTQQIAYDCIELDQPAAVFYMEMKPKEAALRTAGKVDGKNYHLPDNTWTKDELKASLTHPKLEENLHLFDANGVTDWESIQGRILYYISIGVRRFFIDHLTAMATGGDDKEKDELEKIMKGLYEIANRHGAMFHVISHLTTPEGKPHEEGGRVTIRQFKGSRSIGFWSFFMFGIERNQQAEDPDERKVSILRCLKDRLTGRSLGLTIPMTYDTDKGLLLPLESNPFDDEPTETQEESLDF